jgi:hypothetical protein
VGSANVAAVWTSADDGATWRRADTANSAFSIRATTQMFAVSAGGPGVVAVGLSYDINQTIDAHAWFSADGRAWRRAADPPAWSGPGDQTLGKVCRLPDGSVAAVGTVTLKGEQDVWAWVSRDGLTWERATGPGAAVLGGPGNQFPRSCASTPTGVLVAGHVPGPGGSDGVLWATTDGRTWTTVGGPDTFSSPANNSVRGIAVAGARLVVTGVDDGDVTVYTSGDGGSTWRKRTAAGFGGLGFQVAVDVVIAGDEVVMAGIDGPGAAVWVGPAP